MQYCADTWFLLALYDRDTRARTLFENLESRKSWLVVSAIAYAETTKKLFQRGVTESTVRAFWTLLENTKKVQIVPVNNEVGAEAAKISLTYHLSLMDACVAATGKVMYCDILLSGDSDFDLIAKKKYIKVMSW